MLGNAPVIRTLSGFCFLTSFINISLAALKFLVKSSSPSYPLWLLSVGQEAKAFGIAWSSVTVPT